MFFINMTNLEEKYIFGATQKYIHISLSRVMEILITKRDVSASKIQLRDIIVQINPTILNIQLPNVSVVEVQFELQLSV